MTIEEALSRLAEVQARADAADLAEERLNLALSAGQVAWWEMDVATGMVDANDHKALMLGLDPGDYRHCHYTAFTNRLHPEDHDRVMDNMARHLAGTLPLYECEYRIQKSDGSWVWFYDKGSVTRRSPEGRPLAIKGVVIDITALKAALAAKDFLLQEVHHRVKNNLNLMTLLILHLREAPANRVADGLRDLQNRIYTMGALYDLLSRSPSLERINLGSYLSEVARGVLASLAPHGRITLRTTFDELAISHDYGIKLGLIVNEIFTNALKHGFGPGESGTLTLELTAGSPGCTLLIGNSGSPLEPGAWEASDSLGHTLITAFTKELGGTMGVVAGPQPGFVFTFPDLA